jgi:GxxExxY protein
MKRIQPNGDRQASPRIIEKVLSYAIIGCFFEVYNELGFGFAESIYSKAMAVALVEKGLKVEREQGVDVYFHRFR